jgi:hypothetical protein
VEKANFCLIRRSLSRDITRELPVDLEETGAHLGRGDRDFETETTLIHCLWKPGYLLNCRDAAEAVVREINALTKKWDLLVPYRIKPGYRKP